MNTIPASLGGRWVELPALDEAACTGCGICAEVCPTECLEMEVPVPWLPRPGHCISCALCVAVCPVHALHMEKSELA
jgi:NADH-quinone oxidoreductase subunit I